MPAHTTERPIPADPVGQLLAIGARTDSASTSGLADIREHRPASIAHRAVEAAVGLVEVQVAARLRSAPAVQLQLKLGGENLSIRVELREGNVHTQFRTDSAEICQAIAREWDAMRAESPAQALRYLEPEFPAGDAGSSPGGSGRQGQSPHQPARPPLPEIFGGLGRSYPYSQTEPDSPVLEIATLLLPTSAHLSAIA